jgi:two-component sensor histidine kinase
MKYFAWFVFFVLSVNAFGQTKKIDSLRNLLNNKDEFDSDQQYYLYKDIVKNFYSLKEADSVIKYLNLGLPIIIKDNQKFAFYNQLGNIHYIKRDLEKATIALDSCFLIDKRMDYRSLAREANLYKSYGKILLVKKQYEEAEHNFIKALELFKEENKSLVDVAYIHKYLGRLYKRKFKKHKQDAEMALYHFEKALAIFENVNHKNGVSQTLTELSGLYLAKEDFEKAEESALKSLMIAKSSDRDLDLSVSYSRLGRIYYIKPDKDFKKSYQYLTLADKHRNESELENLMHSKLYWYNHYVLQSKIDSANYFINQFILLNDSLTAKVIQNNAEEINVKYQTEKKERELAEQKIATQTQELLTQEANTRNWLLAICILALSISSFFIWRRYKAESRAKQVISHQKDEIEQKKAQVEQLQKEFHHRLKNDYRSINSYISLVQKQTSNTNKEERFNDLKNRVTSMFKVHEILLNEDDITQVTASAFLSELTKSIIEKLSKENVEVIINVDKTETIVADKAIAFGVVVNELITNAYKYAFDGNASKIDILFRSDENDYHLTVKDNGKGLPSDFNIQKLNSLGMTIVPMYAYLHGGSYEINGIDGVTVELSLPKNSKQ